MGDLRPTLGPHFAVFGVPATVTPAGGAPVSTLVIWEPADAAPRTTVQGSVLVVETSPRCSVRRDQVADLPPGSTIVASPAPGAAARTFRVDRIDRADAEILTVMVH